MEGISLAPLLLEASEGFDERAIFAATDYRGERLRSVHVGSHQLIVDLKTDERQLFDLANDPHALSPIPVAGNAIAADLEARLSEHLGGRYEIPATETVELSPERTEELQALGYVD